MNNTNLLENLRKVITLVDQLRDIGLQEYIKLPRIVVLGIQSSGKSSLLEQIVGLDFLPRGEGVVTRRPLELRLQYVPKSKCSEPYAIFEELKGQKFNDFKQVKENIISLTDKVAGTSKNIVDKPIILNVYGPNCPDLTLVDLPGITRIPMPGQDQNIEEVTKNMAMKYCKDKTTIILCVVAANQDLTTSDALLMARQLDPQGERTIGVLTKIDIMDRGTNALNMLRGKEVSMKLGYVGVKLRSQQDIYDNLTVQRAIQLEKEFFASHPAYSSIPGDLFGTQVLTNKLTTILYRQIRACLPELMKEINSRVSDIDDRRKKLGPGLPTEDKEKLHYIWQIINEFTVRFKNSISGSYEKSQLSKKSVIPAGAQIRKQFTELLKDEEDIKYQVLKDLKDEQIQQCIQKYEGDNIPGFLSIDAFFALLTPKLREIQNPARDTVNETYTILEEYANNILNDQLEKLPSVKDLIQEQVLAVIQNSRDLAYEAVQELLESEINYIFTNDLGFLLNQPLPGYEISNEKGVNPLVTDLRRKIEHYYKLVIRSVRDNIPKLIGHFLVKGCQSSMLLQLQENLMQNQEYLNVINEPLHIAEERAKLIKESETLKSAQKIVKRDPDLSDYILRLQQQEEDKSEQEDQQKEEEKPQLPQDTANKQVSSKLINQITASQKNDTINVINNTLLPVAQPDPKLTQQQQQSQQRLNSQQPVTQNQQYQSQQQKQAQNPTSTADPLAKKTTTTSIKDQFNTGIDKAVDKVLDDPKTQEAMKTGARQAAGTAVTQNMPGAPSWVKAGAEKAAESTISNQTVQNAMKDQAKTQIKDQVGTGGAVDNTSTQKEAKSLFGFLNKGK